jgi:hypothetical protein
VNREGTQVVRGKEGLKESESMIRAGRGMGSRQVEDEERADVSGTD